MKARLEDRFTIHSSSYVRPPIQPITLDRTRMEGARVDRAFKSGESFDFVIGVNPEKETLK